MIGKQIVFTSLIASLCGFTSGAFAHSNPINEAYVQLTAADWAAVCTSGSPSAATGCYGNIGSTQYMKIDRILRGFSAIANVQIVSTPNSIFIQQYGPGSNVPQEHGYATIQLAQQAGGNANQLVCDVFTEGGVEVSVAGTTAGIAAGAPATSAPHSGANWAVCNEDVGQTVCGGLAEGGEGLSLTADGATPAKEVLQVALYVLCIARLGGGLGAAPRSLPTTITTS